MSTPPAHTGIVYLLIEHTGAYRKTIGVFTTISDVSAWLAAHPAPPDAIRETHGVAMYGDVARIARLQRAFLWAEAGIEMYEPSQDQTTATWLRRWGLEPGDLDAAPGDPELADRFQNAIMARCKDTTHEPHHTGHRRYHRQHHLPYHRPDLGAHNATITTQQKETTQ